MKKNKFKKKFTKIFYNNYWISLEIKAETNNNSLTNKIYDNDEEHFNCDDLIKEIILFSSFCSTGSKALILKVFNDRVQYLVFDTNSENAKPLYCGSNINKGIDIYNKILN